MINARPSDGQPVRRRDDAGLSMVVTAVSLLAVAALVLISAKAVLGSSTASSTGASVATPLAAGDATEAQQTLSTGLAAATVAGTTGTFVGLDASSLRASEPSISFVDGPSTGPDSVSVASTSEGAGSVTLATRSSDGTCWFAWRSPQAGTWYGAQTKTTTCAAQPVAPTPNPAPVSSTSVGWQQGTFPQA